MKFLFLMMISLLSLSAFAGSIDLRVIENASEYESVEMEYDMSHGLMVVLKANRYEGIPRHPETYVDYLLVPVKELSLEGNSLNVIINRKTTTCAVLVGDVLEATGKCTLKTEVVGNSLKVSLVTL